MIDRKETGYLMRNLGLAQSCLLVLACATAPPEAAVPGPVPPPAQWGSALGGPAGSPVVPPSERWAELHVLRVEGYQDYPVIDKVKLGVNQRIALQVVGHRPGYFAVVRLDVNGAVFFIVPPVQQRLLDPTRAIRIPDLQGSSMPSPGFQTRERFALLVSGQPFDMAREQQLIEQASRLVPVPATRPRPEPPRGRSVPSPPQQALPPPPVVADDDPVEDGRPPDTRQGNWTTSLPPYVETPPTQSAVTVVQVRRRP